MNTEFSRMELYQFILKLYPESVHVMAWTGNSSTVGLEGRVQAPRVCPPILGHATWWEGIHWSGERRARAWAATKDTTDCHHLTQAILISYHF